MRPTAARSAPTGPSNDRFNAEQMAPIEGFLCVELAIKAHRSKGENAMTTQDKAAEGRSRGGQNSGGNFKHDPKRAAEAGRKGGQESGGNFKNDPRRASEAGKKGGESSHSGRR